LATTRGVVHILPHVSCTDCLPYAFPWRTNGGGLRLVAADWSQWTTSVATECLGIAQRQNSVRSPSCFHRRDKAAADKAAADKAAAERAAADKAAAEKAAAEKVAAERAAAEKVAAAERAKKAEEKAKKAEEKDGFALRPLLPGTDLLQSLEALLQTDGSELGKGSDVKKKYGEYDSLKLACAWKVDHQRNLDKYTTGVKRVQKELEMLEKKGKDVSNVPGLPVKTDCVGGFTLSQACNEVILLHGVNPDRLLDLLSTGLNEHFAGINTGTAFGDGVYLAEDAGKTDQYVGPDSAYDPSSELHKRLYDETMPHPEDVLYVLVVRAALGFPMRTQRTLVKKAKTHDLRAARVTSMDNGAPIFPVSCRELSAVPGVMPKIFHHSLIAELGKDIVRYREFVLFNSNYVHIDYVIAYHRYNKGQKLRMTDSPYQA